MSNESIDFGVKAEEPKVLVLVDANNVTGHARSIGRKVNFPGLIEFFSRFGNIDEARIYASLPPENFGGLIRFYDYLNHIGGERVKVIRKISRRLPSGEILHEPIRERLMMDAMYIAGSIRPDAIVLCSGNGSYVPLVLRLRRYGIKTIIAFPPQKTSEELRDVASEFVDLTDFFSSGEPLESRVPESEVPALLKAG